VFINIHPLEMRLPSLLARTLGDVVRKRPGLTIVAEMNESAIADPAEMHDFRQSLKDVGVKLAYDDFGVGRTRLLELVQAPPDYLKFDRSLIHGIHKAQNQLREMVASLIRFVRDVGIVCIAEGVEEEAEAAVCYDLGFQAAQGYLFGKPVPGGMYGIDTQK
jgi:EAL domain-containing protein (putative c-di-GMP-specific phosphodiesterase class I)